MHLQLLIDALDVKLNRERTDEEFLGNLLVAMTFDERLKDIEFAWSQVQFGGR